MGVCWGRPILLLPTKGYTAPPSASCWLTAPSRRQLDAGIFIPIPQRAPMNGAGPSYGLPILISFFLAAGYFLLVSTLCTVDGMPDCRSAESTDSSSRWSVASAWKDSDATPQFYSMTGLQYQLMRYPFEKNERFHDAMRLNDHVASMTVFKDFDQDQSKSAFTTKEILPPTSLLTEATRTVCAYNQVDACMLSSFPLSYDETCRCHCSVCQQVCQQNQVCQHRDYKSCNRKVCQHRDYKRCNREVCHRMPSCFVLPTLMRSSPRRGYLRSTADDALAFKLTPNFFLLIPRICSSARRRSRTSCIDSAARQMSTNSLYDTSRAIRRDACG